MITYTSGTPAERWHAFQNEGAVCASPSNKIPQSKIEEIQNDLRSINPETGHPYGIREIAALRGVGRNTVSKINLKMRRKQH